MGGDGMVRVWDPVVRIGHWLLAALFATAYLTGEVESELHFYVGYAVVALVAWRILWGFIGTPHARFAGFLRGPRETFAYLAAFAAGRPPHYLGHNPAGGWMIVLLLAMLAATTFTGLQTYGAQGHGPFAQAPALVAEAKADGEHRQQKRRRSPRERYWKGLHEGFINATLLLVLLHVAGAAAASIVHRENLVRAMVTGDKRAGPPR